MPKWGMSNGSRRASRRLLAILVLGSLLTGLTVWWLAPRPEPAPAAEFSLLSGGRLALAEWRGRPVLVNFWATTCPPCLEELPDLLSMYNRLHARGLEIVAVAMPYDPPLYVQRFVESRALPWPVALDVEAKITRAFGIAYAPTHVVVDPNGNIVFDHVGKLDFARLERVVEPMLAKKSP